MPVATIIITTRQNMTKSAYKRIAHFWQR